MRLAEIEAKRMKAEKEAEILRTKEMF